MGRSLEFGDFALSSVIILLAAVSLFMISMMSKDMKDRHYMDAITVIASISAIAFLNLFMSSDLYFLWFLFSFLNLEIVIKVLAFRWRCIETHRSALKSFRYGSRCLSSRRIIIKMQMHRMYIGIILKKLLERFGNCLAGITYTRQR